jgi:uncharacterized NAD(P)/FAD-binding protein YdhS
MLGSGLTMVDVVLSLDGQGHRGPITALSRRGLLPLPHAKPIPRPAAAEVVPFGAPISELTAWLRRLAASMATEGADWRSAVDALRPHTSALWQAMSLGQRRRFLRHAKPYWDIHRHRMAPEITERLRALVTEGRLQIVAGRVIATERNERGVALHFRRLGRAGTEIRQVARVVDCTGLADDPLRSTNPLIAALLASGAARQKLDEFFACTRRFV